MQALLLVVIIFLCLKALIVKKIINLYKENPSIFIINTRFNPYFAEIFSIYKENLYKKIYILVKNEVIL